MTSYRCINVNTCRESQITEYRININKSDNSESCKQHYLLFVSTAVPAVRVIVEQQWRIPGPSLPLWEALVMFVWQSVSNPWPTGNLIRSGEMTIWVCVCVCVTLIFLHDCSSLVSIHRVPHIPLPTRKSNRIEIFLPHVQDKRQTVICAYRLIRWCVKSRFKTNMPTAGDLRIYWPKIYIYF